MPELATIGYEGASIDDFIATLERARVALVLDIRQVPASRRPGFSKTKLREALEARGIRYHHLVGLGDPKEGRIAARQGRFAEFRRIFDRHMKTEKAQADLETAARLAENVEVCLLCYERHPEHCHRCVVADALASRLGVTIRHLGVQVGLAECDGSKRSRAGLGTRQSVAACR